MQIPNNIYYNVNSEILGMEKFKVTRVTTMIKEFSLTPDLFPCLASRCLCLHRRCRRNLTAEAEKIIPTTNIKKINTGMMKSKKSVSFNLVVMTDFLQHACCCTLKIYYIKLEV